MFTFANVRGEKFNSNFPRTGLPLFKPVHPVRFLFGGISTGKKSLWASGPGGKINVKLQVFVFFEPRTEEVAPQQRRCPSGLSVRPSRKLEFSSLGGLRGPLTSNLGSLLCRKGGVRALTGGGSWNCESEHAGPAPGSVGARQFSHVGSGRIGSWS